MKVKQNGWVCLFVLLFGGCGLAGAGEDTAHKDIATLIRAGENYRQKGHFREAQANFSAALSAAKQLSAPRTEALSAGLLGYTYLLQRRYQLAEPLLKQAWQMAIQHQWPDLAALHANYLGIFYAGQRRPEPAQIYYQESLKWSLKANDEALAAQARLNLARLANASNKPDQAWKLLRQVQLSLAAVALSEDRAGFWLQIGYQVLMLNQGSEVDNSARIKLAYQALTTASELAVQHADQRSQALARGYLGQLYESQDRLTVGLAYTDQAVEIDQRIGAKDLLLQHEWQRGRLLKAQGHTDFALAAYRRAVGYIEAVRQDIPVDYHDGRSSFRETLEPVYLGLADLLLQQADQLDHPDSRTKTLIEARQTIELIKKTELEDYFNNRCAIQTLAEVDLEQIAPKTAALYPTIFPDRVELLVSLAGGIYHRSVPVPADVVEQNARSLAKSLREFRDGYQINAQRLYSWLIAPVDDLLQQHGVDTLVVIPDGVLRLIPLAALWDGEHFLIERYAVVTSPGLTLFDPKPIPRQDMTALLAGLSEPGPVIKDLPYPVLSDLVSSVVDEGQSRPVRGNKRDIGNLLLTRGLNSPANSMTPDKLQQLLDEPTVFKKVQELLTLPGVEKEISIVSELLPSTRLLNKNFVKQRLGQEVLKQPYRIVHIASHGVFGSSSEQSFIMAYDQIITMDQLEELLRSDKFSDAPIELLTLSACQTAEGDDRSPLGISGIALKAKVRSVLGSLWPVSDEATVKLMQTFYQMLNTVGHSKAQALQKAQIELLRDPEQNHPFFWSPFILIGNWL